MNHKNHKIQVFFALLGAVLLGCNANKQTENLSFDFHSPGYNRPGLFVFEVRQKDPTGSLIRLDTLGLFCTSDTFKSDGMNVMQWEFLRKTNGYQLVDSIYDCTITGISVCDTQLYIHPPRFNCFRILQFAPHPLLINKPKPGGHWSWDLEIGDQWANKETLPIVYNGELNIMFRFNYVFADTTTLSTPYGRLFCKKIHATGESKFGVTTADYFYNNIFGLVRYNVTGQNGIEYGFKLVDRIQNRDSLRCIGHFFYKIKTGVQSPDFLNYTGNSH